MDASSEEESRHSTIFFYMDAMPQRYLITGATGFIGSHVARACLNHGYEVATIARPTSSIALLKDGGAIIYSGDLGDEAIVARALEDADVVVHCAARNGTGTLADFRTANVVNLRGLLNACKGHALSRFVHLSCTTVYADRHHYGSDESEPLPPRHRDACAQSKVEAEQLVEKFYQDYGVPAVVLRAGLVYGPLELRFMPWLIQQMKQGAMRPVSKGRSALDTLFVRNLVDAVFLSVDNAHVVGKAYNVTDCEFVSKRRFVEAVAAALDVPAPRSTQSLWRARCAAWCKEYLGRGGKDEVFSPAAQVRLLGLNLDFNCDRTRQELGYRPRYPFDDAIAETLAWYKGQLEGRSVTELRLRDSGE